MKVEKSRFRRLLCVARRASLLPVLSISLFAASAAAEGGYTNHAGNVVAGWPVKLTQKEVALAEGVVTTNYQLSITNYQLPTTNYQLSTTYPLSIFPESEAALRSYLDKQMESSTITPAERMALGM